MKRIIPMALILMCLSPVFAKIAPTGFTEFYKAYHEYPNTISFKIPASLASFIVTDEPDEVDALLEHMDDILFLVFEQIDKHVLTDLNNYLPKKDYKELMVVNEGTSEVFFLAHQQASKIDEIVMTVISDNELVVMCLKGDFSKEDAKKLASSVNIKNAVNREH